MASDDDGKDYHEGPDASRRAEHTLTRVLTVSKDELAKREAAYKIPPGQEGTHCTRPLNPVCGVTGRPDRVQTNERG